MSIQYSEMDSLSQENQKFSDGYFQDSIFFKIGTTYQFRPNQTSQCGILQSVQHHVRAYPKKFELNKSNGS